MLNEVVRITYSCNFKCIFCNIIETNNYGSKDIADEEVVEKILELKKKYKKSQLNNLTLSFSGGEPLLNKNIYKYIRLSKKIGFRRVDIQTNGFILFKQKKIINNLIYSGLDKIFLGFHSHNDEINRKMGFLSNINDFLDWFNYIKENNLEKKILISINIVITKQNIYVLEDYIDFLINHGIIDSLGRRELDMGFVFPNGYAFYNKNELFLDFNENQKSIIYKVIEKCKKNNINIDFHFSTPPLCIINYPQYNLEYQIFKNGEVLPSNADKISDDKKKFEFCKYCKYTNYCRGFDKYMVDFWGGEEEVKHKIDNDIFN